eukprot:scaffold11_cov248-Chaetoceros_neogracile.AAC.17
MGCSEDMKHFSTPPTESWNDFPSDSNPAVFEIDMSKTFYQWDLAKKEIRHLLKRMKQLFTREEAEEVSNAHVELLIEGLVLSEGFVLTDGTILIEETMLIDGFILTDGTPLNEGWVLIEGIALSDGTMLLEGLVRTYH